MGSDVLETLSLGSTAESSLWVTFNKLGGGSATGINCGDEVVLTPFKAAMPASLHRKLASSGNFNVSFNMDWVMRSEFRPSKGRLWNNNSYAVIPRLHQSTCQE